MDACKLTRALCAIVLIGVALANTGCTWLAYLGTDYTGREHGKTFYIGGAGPMGNIVGTVDVPRGLRHGGYRGAIETFAWQSVVGGTIRDQVDKERNQEQAQRLANRIQAYLAAYPGRRVNIIALSAGTGIATWALENLPEDTSVGTVVFLASSLSRRYDLTEALKHIDGHLYSFHSARDHVLRYGVPITGPVDRADRSERAAGLHGFLLPPEADRETRRVYRDGLRNRRYKRKYARYGYRGQHADATHPRFISRVITPLLFEHVDSHAEGPEEPSPTSAPATGD